MGIAQAQFEPCKIRVDLVVDIRGVLLDKKLKEVEHSMTLLKYGEVLMLFSSDFKNQDKLPEWINNRGYLFLSMTICDNYFKIIILKF